MTKRSNLDYFGFFKEIIVFKLGWPAVSKWTNFDYKTLSDLIKTKTGEQVSSSTLKRMFGKWDYEGGTSPYTKNTMAAFIDFKDWYGFCNFIDNYTDTSEPFLEWYQSQQGDKNLQPGHLAAAQAPVFTKKRSAKFGSGFYLLLLIVTLSAAGFILFKYTSAFDTPSRGSIAVEMNTGTYPWTSIFNYTVQNKSKDSIYLDFDDVITETAKTSDKITHLFLFPGYYKTQIISKKYGLLDSTYTHVHSKGWCKTLAPTGFRKYPLLVQDIETPYAKTLWLKHEIDSICRVRIDKPECKVWVGARLFKDFEYTLDDFTFSTVVANNPEMGGIKAHDAVITLKGEFSNIRVHLIQKGGFKWIDEEFSDVQLDGDKQDLSKFEHDLSRPTKINITGKNQTINVQVAGKEIYSTGYTQKIGLLKGVIVDFRGNGHLMSAVMNGDTLK